MQPQTPTRNSELTLAAREEIDGICRRFEAAWKSGQRPEIQAAIEVASPLTRLALLRRLVALDLDYRRQSGEKASALDYAARFPELADHTVSHESLGSESLVGTQTRTATFRPDSSPQEQRVEIVQPESVGRYEIRSLLGRGAFGAVYLGWDPQLKRQVAIKVPRLAAENNDEQIEAFLEEARRAVQLERHQGIVPVYDVGRAGDLCYIVSQYIEGGTLTQLLKAGPPPVETSVQLMITLADVVHFAHRQGWVHRDIKPSNILLDASGKAYLADFGLTSRLDEMRSADGPPNGTPNYMAPELVQEAVLQMRRQSSPAALRPDQRSDVYSLGVVLYQLLTGRTPFEANTLPELFDLVLHSDPVPPRLANPSVPKRLEEICLKALAKDPGQRYRTANDLRDDLSIVATALTAPAGQVKINDGLLWGLTPVRLAAVLGTGFVLCALVIGALFAASYGFRKPVEAPSGGETNVAMLEQGPMARGFAGPSPGSTTLPDAIPQVRDRKAVFAELRAMLREESEVDGTDRTAEVPPNVAAKHSFATPRLGETPTPPTLAPAASADSPLKFRALESELQLARDKRDSEREYSLLMRASNEYLEAGQPKDAEQAALRLTELSAKDKAKSPISYGQLGIAQAALGKYDEALVSHERALAGYREVYAALQESKQPEAKTHLSHISRLLGLTLNRIGNVQKQLKQYDAADKAYLEAETVLKPFTERKSELTTVYMNRGSLLSVRRQHEPAIEQLNQALKLAEEQGDLIAQGEVLLNLGNAQARSGSDAQAIASYAKADELLPEQAPYATRSRLLYNWITSLLAEQKYDEARHQIERLRQIARPDDPLAQRLLKTAEPLKDE